jgi:hypothetical protein
MTVHLSKLAVGCDSLAVLHERQNNWTIKRADGQIAYRHRTRYLPKRHDEMRNMGSMYWIIKHLLVARQLIIDFELIGEGRESYVLIHLDPQIITVLPTPRRAHQGWRYLEDSDAPADVGRSGIAGAETLPAKLMTELRSLGLI